MTDQTFVEFNGLNKQQLNLDSFKFKTDFEPKFKPLIIRQEGVMLALGLGAQVFNKEISLEQAATQWLIKVDCHKRPAVVALYACANAYSLWGDYHMGYRDVFFSQALDILGEVAGGSLTREHIKETVAKCKINLESENLSE